MKIKSRLFIPIAAILLLALNLGVGILLINASRESQVTISHLEALKRNRLSQEQLEADLLSQETAISTLQHVLPQQTEIPLFIQFVTDTGKSEGIDISPTFSTDQPSKTKDSLYIIPFVVTYRGDPTKVPQIMAALHQGVYQVRFKHTQVQQNGSQPANIRLEADVYVAGL